MKTIDVDEYLQHVGQFGKFQILLIFLFNLLILPSTYQTMIMGFVGNNPDWRCTDLQHNASSAVYAGTRNSTLEKCSLKGDIGPGDNGHYKDNESLCMGVYKAKGILHCH